MITSLEKITISGNKLAEVFIHVTPEKKFVVSIPDINWSAQFNQIDELAIQSKHLQSSLNFHMFEGNTDELVLAITNLVAKYF
ncbi:YueH family protein [Niallia nealsonii]|uniref:Uncharacterized protein n=1 Tax=Niallia nealsonii TaxID=115979 RepID=A0A2N0Z034_9BACI|nr:YueH family protein [Niallia nealsonii]PKG22848.1 hypothetical protein CWS01_14265 [Niallia nealsonii]